MDMVDERMTDMPDEHMTGKSDEVESYADLMSKAQSLAHGSAARMANMKHDRMAAAQAKRLNRTEAALGASVVVEQFQKSFLVNDRGDVVSRIAAVVVPCVPLFFLKPERRGPGVAGFASDPRVWPLVLAAGVAVAKGVKDKAEAGEAEAKKATEDVEGGLLSIVRDVPLLDAGRRYKLHLGGGFDPEAVRWETDNAGSVTVDKGLVTAVGKGSATITASADGLYDNVVVRVQ